MQIPADDASPVSPPAEWLSTRRFALLLGLCVFASWPQVFLGLQTFVYRDFGYYAYPIAHHLKESFWQGEVPLWNPLSYCGIPFLAQWNTQALYPPALFYVLLPLSWSLGVFCLLHLYGAGLGMFLLARAWTGNSVAAALAALSYAFGGLMVNSLMWPGTVPGLCWMPWLVWLAPLAWRQGGRWVIYAALVGALQMLSGAVEPILMTWLILAGLGALDFFGGDFPRFKIAVRAVGVGALVAGLSVVQLLPFLDLLTHSQREGGLATAAMWPMPTWGWRNFFMPLVHEHNSFHGVYMQRDQYWTYSYFVGLPVMGLAGWALWLARDRAWRGRILCLWGLCLGCLVLALGEATPVYVWCRNHLPVIGTMRFPIKFVILPVMVFPLLAAVGASKLRRKGWLWLGLGTLLAGAAVLLTSWLHPLPDDEWGPTWSNAAARLGFLVAVALVFWRAAVMTELKPKVLLTVLGLVLVWLDVSHHAPQPQTVRREAYTQKFDRPLPLARYGQERMMIDRAALEQINSSYIPDPLRDFSSRFYAFANNCNLLEDVPKVNGFFPLQVREFYAFSGETIYGPDAAHPHPKGLLDFLGVTQLTSPKDIFELEARPGGLPLLTAGQQVRFAADKAIWQAINSTNFNPRAEVYLSEAAKTAVGERAAAAVVVSVAAYGRQMISATLDASAPTVAVVAQTYYHLWRPYVDGQPAELLRANQAFQAVAIPAGKHELKLVYEDRRFKLGALISGLTLLGCLGVMLRLRGSKA